MDIKKLTGHQLVVVIVRNGKDRLADQILQRKLGQNDRFILLNIRQIGKILSGFARDIELGLLTGDGGVEFLVCLDDHVVVRQFADNIRKDLCVDGDNAPFLD